MVQIDPDKCVVCGGCIDLCPSIAISMVDDLVIIDDQLCTECGICVKVCPMNAPVQTDN